MTLNLSRTYILGLAALTVATMSANAQGILAQYGEIVHAVGDPVPPAAPGVTPAPGATIFATSNFDSPTMDQNGTIVYRARMTGGGVSATDDRAYFLGRASGDLLMVARNGDPAPGLPGFAMRTATGVGLSNPPRISPYGEFLFFQSTLYDTVLLAAPPTTADTALFWGPAGGLQLLAREGDLVPFLGGGETFGPFGVTGSPLQYSAVNQNGSVMFFGQLLGGASTTADDGYLCSGPLGGLQLVLREGENFGGAIVAPASGATQLSFTTQLNAAGQVLHGINFSTTVGTATTADDRALAIWTPFTGQSVILIREGSQADGLPAGVVYGPNWSISNGSACFTNNGNTANLSLVSGPGITSGVNDTVLHYGGLSGLVVVYQRGDLCPGLAGGEMFGVTGGSSLTCNDLGQVAFINTMTGPSVTSSNDSSIWLGSAGNLTMLAREGDPVPGFAGYTFAAINTGSNNPLLNGRGDVLFQASITDGVNFRTILFGHTPQHGLRAMLLDTDTFTTSQGTGAWTGLSSTAGFNSGDGGQSMFNNQGDFVYRPSFAAPVTAAILRGHLGSMVCEPSSVPVTGGVPQNFHIDVGPAFPFHLYVVLATSLGTRPGFFSPFGPQNIPLNFDPLWTQLSLDAANSVVWINNLGITDASGKGIGPAGFVMPTGFPGFAGTTVHHAAVILDLTLTQTMVSEPSALKIY